MTTSAHRVHDDHDHEHGPDCGHAAVDHEGHLDYIHHGHAHHQHAGHYDEQPSPRSSMLAMTTSTVGTAVIRKWNATGMSITSTKGTVTPQTMRTTTSTKQPDKAAERTLTNSRFEGKMR